jgi:hypothetical protein
LLKKKQGMSDIDDEIVYPEEDFHAHHHHADDYDDESNTDEGDSSEERFETEASSEAPLHVSLPNMNVNDNAEDSDTVAQLRDLYDPQLRNRKVALQRVVDAQQHSSHFATSSSSSSSSLPTLADGWLISSASEPGNDACARVWGMLWHQTFKLRLPIADSFLFCNGVYQVRSSHARLRQSFTCLAYCYQSLTFHFFVPYLIRRRCSRQNAPASCASGWARCTLTCCGGD